MTRLAGSLSRSSWLGASAAGALALSWPRALRAQTVTLKIGALISDSFAMAYYARDAGFFGNAGIEADLMPFNNGAAQAAAAAGGALDVGAGEATELANGVIRGLPFGILAAGSLYETTAPTTLLCVAKNSPIKTAKDLEGQTVGVPALVALTATAVRAWVVESGADLSKVKFVEIPLPQMAEAVAHGTIAAAHIGEPQLTLGAALLQPIAKPYDAIAKTFNISHWFTTKGWVARNPDVAKRLVDVAYETARWANANHEQTLDILAKYAKFNLDAVRKMTRSAYSTSLDLHLIQPVLDAGYTYKALPRRFDANDLVLHV